MKDEDPLNDKFGISSHKASKLLELLASQLRSGKQRIHENPSNKELTLKSATSALISVSDFLREIPVFAQEGLPDLVEAVIVDLLRAEDGNELHFIRPLNKGSGRPKDFKMLVEQKAWAAAYMHLLKESGMSKKAAADKAVRDIDQKGRLFPGGKMGSASITVGRVQDWRSKCTGAGADPTPMTRAFETFLQLAEESGLTGEEAAKFLLEMPTQGAMPKKSD